MGSTSPRATGFGFLVSAAKNRLSAAALTPPVDSGYLYFCVSYLKLSFQRANVRSRL